MSDVSLAVETPRTIRLNNADNVVVAAAALAAGTAVPGESVVCTGDVPRGHKIAARRIAGGEPVVKFAQVIGYAAADIAPSEHVHTHNCLMGEHDRDYAIGVDVRPTELLAESERATFQGFVRATSSTPSSG
jgi:altronate hydrolase